MRYNEPRLVWTSLSLPRGQHHDDHHDDHHDAK
jgi:hypothetical protein